MSRLSRTDNEFAMKQELKISRLTFNSGHKIATISLAAGIAFSAVATAELQIVGPKNQAPAPVVQQAPAPQEMSVPTISTATELLYEGPTRDTDTLWSIASAYMPKRQNVSVYQTIGAIFKLNPDAFKTGSIHGLIPGSFLAMPTLEQIRDENSAAVVKLLQGKNAEPSAPIS